MDFSRKGVAKKQKQLVSKLPRNKRKISVSLFKALLVVFLVIVVAGVGAVFGMFKAILEDTPDINADDLIPTGYKTTLYDQDGNVVTTLSNFDSNREYVYYNDIPENLVNAFVAIEDKRFWEHNGIDMQGIMRAAIQTLQGDTQGASTLTQQLIKNQIYNVGLDEETFVDSLERKIQEQYLAVEIEKVLTKEEIVEYYLNTIYLSQGRYGVQTAAEYYFDKELDELTVSECAVLAAIPQNPSKYDPIAFPEENAKRRLSVLNSMKELGYINQAQYDEALSDNIYEQIASIDETRDNTIESVNSYYIDEVISQLEDDFMAMGYTKSEASNLVYSGGLSVYICQDDEIQNICDEVLNDDENYPSGKYQLSYALTLADKDGNQYNYSQNMMVKWFQEEQGDTKFDLLFSDPDSAREAADTYKAAMLEETGYTYLLESYKVTIQPQISFTLIEQETGQVKAIVGGRGEKTENRSFNRATEATRQPGSAFKVLAAFLPALEGCGMTLATTYEDEPYNYANGRPVKNWYSGYKGPSSIRDGIRESMNIIAVKTITDVTPELSYEYLLQLGFTTLVERRTEKDGSIVSDIHQSSALGGLTDGITNLEITAAYATIANEGQYIKPVFYTKVLDHDGNVLIDNSKPEETYVISEQNAWLLIDAMKDVVTSGTGTGTSARLHSGLACAGKTGTTSNNYDAWFCGMTPYYTASIWIGYDTNTKFSSGSYHKIMWRKIMDQIVESKELDTSADWTRPGGIVTATVCDDSGLLPVEGKCGHTHTEYFASGTVPTKHCDYEGDETIVICNESHLPATEFCPDTTTYTYEYDEDDHFVITDANFPYDESILRQKCPIHTEETATEAPSEGTTGDNTGTKYTITSSSGNGGSISPSISVNSGSSATFYIASNKGYEIADVKVDGKSVGAVSSYKFTNVTSNHTISVTFRKAQTEAPTTEAPPTTTEAPTTEAPTTEAPPTTTEAPTTEAPTTETPSSEVPQAG